MLDPGVLRIQQDTTTRLSCRDGDRLLRFRFNGFFASVDDKFKMTDIWKLRDGEFVTVTNRYLDIPTWFQLHPLETANAAARWIIAELDRGYQPPEEPIEGPGIWRIHCGDLVVYLGSQTKTDPLEFKKKVILRFETNSLVLLEGRASDQIDDWPDADIETLARSDVYRSIRRAVADMGMPRTLTEGNWTIGV